MKYITSKQRQPGFTIVELLVVIVVIAILAAITIVSYNAVTNNATQKSVETDAQSMVSQLSKYRSEAGRYPDNLNSLTSNSALGSTFQYSYDANTDSYCLTATLKKAAAYANSSNSGAKDGLCPGHGANGTPLLINVAQNPNATAVAAFGGGGTGANTLRSDGGYNGSTYVRRTFSGAGVGGVTIGTGNTTYIPVTYGKTYTISAWVRSNKTGPQFMLISWLTASGGSGSLSSSPAVSVSGTWTRITFTGVVPAGDVGFPDRPQYAAVTIRGGSSLMDSAAWAINDYQDIDGIMATEGSTVYSFKDGSFPGCSWMGTANASSSACEQ